MAAHFSSSAILEKKLVTRNFTARIVATQGLRPDMQDTASVSFPDLETDDPVILAIFDGHGHSLIADFLANSLITKLRKIENPVNISDLETRYSEKVVSVFENTDHEICSNLLFQPDSGGSTGTVVIIFPKLKKILTATFGDSKAILTREGKIIELSGPPMNPLTEMDRIHDTGGLVINGRINCCLAVSRSFGDLKFKDIGLISTPVVCFTDYSENDKIFIASDGLWNGIPTDYLSSERDLLNIIKDAAVRSKDNVTVIELMNKFEILYGTSPVNFGLLSCGTIENCPYGSKRRTEP